MSDTDSFIKEVSEEVRRDRQYRLMRKYGWVAVLLVLLLVGGAAFNEWRKSSALAAAQTLGDQILAALQMDDRADRSTALRALSAKGDQGALLVLLASGESVDGGDKEGALQSLRMLAEDTALATTYRHLAELKLILLQADTLTPSERITRLEPLAIPGAPFRLLAEEQMAMALVESGYTPAALDRLRAILDDGDVTAGLRRRVSQLIVALGGELAPV